MKIGIDCRLWGTQHAGIGRYTEELVKNLQKVDKRNNYILFCRKKDFNRINSGKWKKVVADVPHYTLQEQLVLPFIFNIEKLDLLHVPHFNVPILYNRPFVVTIHDILWHNIRGADVTTQTPLVYSIKHLGYRLVVRNAIFRSEKILVPSNTVKQDLVSRFNLPESQVAVTYEGVPPAFGGNVQLPIANVQLLKKYKIKKPYLLYVGNLYPHKNVEALVRVLKKLRLTNDDLRLTLIIVCGRSVFWESFRKFVEHENADGFVKLVGYVSDAELGALYKNAEAFVFPTLSEGFGLPGLEAMMYGTPVVCSDIPVLREIYGNAAVYFDPKDPLDIARKIKKASSSERPRLKELGKERVKKYSWRKMAEETLEVYNLVEYS